MSDKTQEPTPKQDAINDAEVRAYEENAFVRSNIDLVETAQYTNRRNLESLANAYKAITGTQDRPGEIRGMILDKIEEMLEAMTAVEICDCDGDVLTLWFDPNTVEDDDFVNYDEGPEGEVGPE